MKKLVAVLTFAVVTLVTPNAAYAISTDKIVYTTSESILVTCDPANQYQLYIVPDLYQYLEYTDQGLFPCADPYVELTPLPESSYVMVEVVDGENCSVWTYEECISYPFAIGEFRFKVEPAGSGIQVRDSSESGLRSYTPEIQILSPKSSPSLPRSVAIEYVASDKNDERGADEKAMLGLGDTPVSFYYSDLIAEWDHEVVPAQDKTAIQKGLPAQGTYTWDASALLPGVFYRLIAEAVDVSKSIGVAVTDAFTIDITDPVFTITSEPPVTRSHDVTLTVESSETLSGAPKVTVTQKGAAPVTVSMEGEGTTYTGVYVVQPGFDGTARITVEGTDLAGNKGTVIARGGTFAVGINPPPKPVIQTPTAESSVVADESLVVRGTTREDTMIVVVQNGGVESIVVPDAVGNFSFTARLDRTYNQGANILTIAAQDVGGVRSEEVLRTVKFNREPVVRLVAPLPDAELSNTVVIQATSTDENRDPLLFTFEIAPAETPDSWVVLAENVPSARYLWNTSEFDDGEYLVRARANDGTAVVSTQSVSVSVRNVDIAFRFENGRRTFAATSSASIAGRVLIPLGAGEVSSVVYSTNTGETWIPITFSASADGLRFTVALTDLQSSSTRVLFRALSDETVVARGTHTVVMDTEAPTAPRLTEPPTTISNENDASVNAPGLQVRLRGAAEAGSEVTLVGFGGTRTTRADGIGRFTFETFTIPTRGVYDVSLTATDSSGNISATTTETFVYNNPPRVTILEPKPLRGLSGQAVVRWSVSDLDQDPIQSVELRYRRGNGTYLSLPIEESQGAYLWDVRGLQPGKGYELELRASDGLQSSSAAVEFAIDGTAPTLDSITLPVTNFAGTARIQGSGVATDALSGVEYVEYALREVGNQTRPDWVRATIQSGFLAASARFSILYSAPLPDGVYDLLVRAVDGAGNVSNPETRRIRVDTEAPRVGAVSFTAHAVHLAPDEDGVVTVYRGSEYTFGVALEDDTVSASVHVGTTTLSLTRSFATGLWEASIAVTEVAGTRVSVSATDASGNQVTQKEVAHLVSQEKGSVRMNGTPVHDAQVFVLTFDERTGEYDLRDTLVTDAAGQFELALPPGNYRLVMQESGYQTQAEDFRLSTSSVVGVAFETEKLSTFGSTVQYLLDYLRYPL